MPILACLLAAALLNACAPIRSVQQSLLVPDWFSRPPQTELSVAACYRTLAEVDCYLEPQPEFGSRRVGWFDAPRMP